MSNQYLRITHQDRQEIGRDTDYFFLKLWDRSKRYLKTCQSKLQLSEKRMKIKEDWVKTKKIGVNLSVLDGGIPSYKRCR
jgi:hypothetical protein